MKTKEEKRYQVLNENQIGRKIQRKITLEPHEARYDYGDMYRE